MKGKALIKGIRVETYLDLTVEMTGFEFLAFLKLVGSALPKNASPNLNVENGELSAMIGRLTTFLVNYGGELVKNSGPLIDLLKQTVQVKKTDLIVSAGLGLGVGGRAAAGLKARVDIAGQGGEDCKLSFDRLSLEEVTERVYQVLEAPPKYFPGCAVIQSLYAPFGEDKKFSLSGKPDSKQLTRAAGSSPKKSMTFRGTQGVAKSRVTTTYDKSVLRWMKKFDRWDQVTVNATKMAWFVEHDSRRGELKRLVDLKDTDTGVALVFFFAARVMIEGRANVRVAAIAKGEYNTNRATRPTVETLEPARFIDAEGTHYWTGAPSVIPVQ